MSNKIAVSNHLKTPPSAIAKLNTPQLIKAGLSLTWGASFLLLITTLSGIQSAKLAIKTVGKDAAPSIEAAQYIKAGLADMDANIANELIEQPGQNQSAVKAYGERLEKVTTKLITAAENITYGDAERIPIQTLQIRLSDYIAKVQQARDFHQRRDLAGVLNAYRASAELIDQKLSPAADQLLAANQEALNRTYEQQWGTSVRSLFFIIISTLILLGTLIILQLFLYRRMRRIINPMLLTATAITLLFFSYITSALLSASNHLKIAKQDAFNSIDALWKTRALAYSANADESRYLLDQARANNHQQAFLAKITKLANIPTGQTFATVASAFANNQKVDNFTGFLADELNNITFAGEKKSALNALEELGLYVTIDQKIRQLQQTGKSNEAIALCTGNKPGESNWAFNQFDLALQKTLDINQQAFDQAVDQGFKDVEGFEIIIPIVTIAIGLLTLLGLLPRWQEYSR